MSTLPGVDSVQFIPSLGGRKVLWPLFQGLQILGALDQAPTSATFLPFDFGSATYLVGG